MQTILGASGQIGEELARALKKDFTSHIRVVSRHPVKINDSDEIFAADLTVKEEAVEAVKGTDIAYFTLGLPIDTAMWAMQFPLILRNVIDACIASGAKLVFFDNTYMYPQDGRRLTEETVFDPVGKKGRVRMKMAEMVLAEMRSGRLEAVICRAPEFYGPAKTQSVTNTLLFKNIKLNKRLKVPVSDSKKRSLIWTPDASRATALIGNTPDAYGQTWHLPVDNSYPTYKELIALCSEINGHKLPYTVVPAWVFRVGALFNKNMRELLELLPRYAHNCIFDDSKFRTNFPGFRVTTYREGVERIKEEQMEIG